MFLKRYVLKVNKKLDEATQIRSHCASFSREGRSSPQVGRAREFIAIFFINHNKPPPPPHLMHPFSTIVEPVIRDLLLRDLLSGVLFTLSSTTTKKYEQ